MVILLNSGGNFVVTKALKLAGDFDNLGVRDRLPDNVRPDDQASIRQTAAPAIKHCGFLEASGFE